MPAASEPAPASGQAEAAQHFAACQRRNEALPLLFVAENEYRRSAERCVRRHCDRMACVELRQLFDDEHVAQIVASHTAQRLRNRHAQEPHFGHHFRGLPREFGGRVQLVGNRGHSLAAKAVDLRPQIGVF